MTLCSRLLQGTLLALVLTGTVLAADVLGRDEFAWRATLNVPAGASVARVALPADALLRMQSSKAADVRVFNAAGDAVAYAVLVTVQPALQLPAVHTRTYRALPLYANQPTGPAAKGAVQVRVDGNATSAWVHLESMPQANTGTSAPAALQAALFDTRAEKQSLVALQLQAQLPANTLVHFTAAVSADLQTWTPLHVKGPLFRFEGSDAPVNNTLELPVPVELQGRYLRIAWDGVEGVHLTSLRGTAASTFAPVERLSATLGPGQVEEGKTQTWPLEFATPVAALHLQSLQDNTLLPLRILGRDDVSLPWRTLGHTVVYRLNTGGQIRSNGVVLLSGATTRWLRVETTNGLALPGGGLQASVEFLPVNIAFVATGSAPFTLAVGRARTAPMAVDASLMGSIAPSRLADLPVATAQQVRADVPRAPQAWAAALFPAGTSLRSSLLWAVLVGGVLVLAVVAYSLVRQLGANGKEPQ